MPWQMLLPYIVAYGIAISYVVDGINHRGRWYYPLLSKVADVIGILFCVTNDKSLGVHVAIEI